jgi:hypothetical protein
VDLGIRIAGKKRDRTGDERCDLTKGIEWKGRCLMRSELREWVYDRLGMPITISFSHFKTKYLASIF